jgi:excisionase family DNA binding protein
MPNDATNRLDELVNIPAAAKRAGVSRQAAYAWVAQGRLRAIPTGRGYRVAAADLDRFLAERRAAKAVGIRPATVRRWIDGARPRS